MISGFIPGSVSVLLRAMLGVQAVSHALVWGPCLDEWPYMGGGTGQEELIV